MNGVQRITKSLHFEKSDRAAIIPELIQHNLDVAGQKHGAFSTNPDVMCEVILAGLKAYETDAVYVSSDNYLIAEAMGAEVKILEDAPPALISHAVHTLEDAVRLEPLDVNRGRIPVILKATRQLRKELKDETFVKTCIDSAPFSAAATLLGPEEWMMSLLDAPEMCHEFLDICTESVIRYGLAAAKAGAHGLAFGDSAAGLVSRAMYEEFALPYVKRVIEVFHDQTGLPVFYHVCGNTKHILDLMVETGADCIEIDSVVSMELAKEAAYGKCAVEGNVSTIESFLNGTPEDVKREVYHILDLYGNNGGVIISSACEIPRWSPKENVRALTDAVISYPYNR